MFTALVPIQASRESTPETPELVAEIPGVDEVYWATGKWDLIAVVRSKGFEQFHYIVTLGLCKHRGIVRNQTSLAFWAHSRKLHEQGFSIGSEGS